MKTIELKNIIPLISYDVNKNVAVVSNQQLFFFIEVFKNYISTINILCCLAFQVLIF